MGQYYHPINIDKEEWLNTHDYGNGLKLMEHSYIGNNFMNAVCGLLIPGGSWYKDRIVWAGDYADPEPAGDDEDIEQCEHCHQDLPEHMRETKELKNLHTSIGIDGNKINPPSDGLDASFRYLLNHDKKQFVDLTDLRPIKDDLGIDTDWIIHPLSLLTCEGNGRGGGDYRGEDELVGSWARDHISIEKEIPNGFSKLVTNFIKD